MQAIDKILIISRLLNAVISSGVQRIPEIYLESAFELDLSVPLRFSGDDGIVGIKRIKKAPISWSFF